MESGSFPSSCDVGWSLRRTGVVSGVQYSHKYNVNPWTGELKPVYHYTNSAYVNSINETEIRQSNDGFTYTTTNPNYSSDEAMKALDLKQAGGVRDAVIKIDAAKMATDGILPSIGPRPVVNGTGVEILYKGDIPSKYIFK